MNDETLKKITHFFAEIGNLRRIKRTGFVLAGIENPESIADHVVRAAQIGYILAFLEGADPEKTATMILFHDNAEIRIGDQHKVAARYFNIGDAENKAMKEQVNALPEELKERVLVLMKDFEERRTKEGIVAKDADWLECAIEAKGYKEKGVEVVERWIENVKKALETDSAKKLLELIDEEEDFTNSWWQGLQQMT